MSFKKNSLIKKQPSSLVNIVGIISLCIIFVFGLFTIKYIDFFNFKIIEDNTTNNSGNIIKEINYNNDLKNNEIVIKNTKIIKKDNNKINILIVGIGGGNHDAPDLTDTIILASINKKSEAINLLSIPRDLYVDYPNSNNNGKINGLYAKYKNTNSSKGISILKDKVSQITGEEIDFFINIDFNGFIEVIDTIGGIKMTIPEDFVDNEYPDGNWGYKTLLFKKGTWIFNGENTLKYARSRHSTSDFDRSIRQQQIIESIKNKLTGNYFFTSPLKIKELYEVFKNNVYTDLDLTTILKIAYNLNLSGDYKITSSNINNSCFYGSDLCEKGGFLYNPSREFFGGLSVLLVEGTDVNNLNNYSKLHDYTNIVFNNDNFFTENYKINIFNSLKISNLAGALSNKIIRYGFNIPLTNSIGNTPTIYKKSIIYYNNIDSDSKTIKILKTKFKGKFKKTDFPVYSKNNAKIEIIIGEDYLLNNNIFNF